MGTQYTHFAHKERTRIYGLRKDQLSLREMGRRLRRSHTSLSRELTRKAWPDNPYFPRGAPRCADYRLQRRAKRERRKAPQLRAYVHQKIVLGWTPELIAGRLKHQGELPSVCHEAIYQYIYTKARALRAFLPHQLRRRTPQPPSRKTGKRIKNRTGLEQRPQTATLRHAYGHGEADMMVAGDRTHGLKVLVERKSRLLHLRFLANKTAVTTPRVIRRRRCAPPRSLRQSSTSDTGSEHADHEAVNAALGTHAFFGAPDHSWEKGRVEQINGLIRRFLPKGTNCKTVEPSLFNRIEKLLTNRPRKCLPYRMPDEVFRAARGALDG